jgi:hypothetical protein
MVNLTDCPAGDTQGICNLLSGLGVGTGNLFIAITPSMVYIVAVFGIIGAIVALVVAFAHYVSKAGMTKASVR